MLPDDHPDPYGQRGHHLSAVTIFGILLGDIMFAETTEILLGHRDHVHGGKIDRSGHQG